MPRDGSGGGLDQIDHPDREYPSVATAFPDHVLAEYVLKAYVEAWTQQVQQAMEEDPFGTMERITTTHYRLQAAQAQNHIEAEGI